MGNQLQPDTRLNQRYLIRRVSGQGGFGITYEAYNELLDRRVAIKELFIREFMERDPQDKCRIILNDENFRTLLDKSKEDFLREARVVGRYSDSPSIVDVTDFFEENGTAYLVMEYLEGQSLSDFMKIRRKIPVREAFEWFLPLMESLNKIHGDQVIHRDLSPDNLMVMSDHSLVLMDFGAARSFGDTQKMSRIVKDGFAPVEQYADQGKQGPWTDIYALCATLYFCITGISPESSVSRMLYDELERPSAFNVAIDEKLEAVLMKGLAVAPEQRYQSLDEMICEIRSAIPEAESAREKEAQEDAGKKTKKSLAAKWILLFILLAGLSALAAYFIIQNSKNSQTLEYDPETMYKVTLSAPDTISVKGYDYALETIEERVKILCGQEDYLLTELDGNQLEIILPGSCFYGENLADTLRCYISRATKLSLVNSSSDYASQKLSLERSDLESVSEKEGTIPGHEELSENEGSDSYPYLEIVLTDDYAAEYASELSTWGEDIILAQDTDNDYWFYYSTYSAGDGKTFYIYNNDKEGNFRELMYYNLTHEALEEGFYYSIDVPIEWEDTQKASAAGKNQVNQDELSGDLFEIKYNVPDDQTAGEKLDQESVLKKRLDLLEQPYAWGTISKDRGMTDQDQIVIRTGLEHMNTEIAALLGTAQNGFTLLDVHYSCSISDYSQSEDEMQLTENEDGSLGLLFTGLSERSFGGDLAKMTAGASEGNPQILYLMQQDDYEGNEPLLYASLTAPVEDELLFDSLYMEDGEKISEGQRWLLNLLLSIWQEDTLPERLSISGEKFIAAEEDEELSASDFGLISLSDAEHQKIIERIQEACPQASAWYNGGLYVSLGLEIDDKLADTALAMVQKIYEAADLENSLTDSLMIYLCEEDNSIPERARISFHKYQNYSEQDSYYEMNTYFYGGRLEEYSQAFETTLEESPFMQSFPRGAAPKETS